MYQINLVLSWNEERLLYSSLCPASFYKGRLLQSNRLSLSSSLLSQNNCAISFQHPSLSSWSNLEPKLVFTFINKTICHSPRLCQITGLVQIFLTRKWHVPPVWTRDMTHRSQVTWFTYLRDSLLSCDNRTCLRFACLYGVCG